MPEPTQNISANNLQENKSEQIMAENNANIDAQSWKITVIIKDPQGNEAWQFIAEDGKNIAEQAIANGVMLPLSCGAGVCGVCLCKVEAGWEILKPDAFNTPMMPLQNDENGNPLEVLTCIAGFKPEAFTDGQNHTVVLQRTY